MTITTDDELLKLAEAATLPDDGSMPSILGRALARQRLWDAATPDRVIALLETITDLRAKLRECSR